jgi:hypothetical protein
LTKEERIDAVFEGLIPDRVPISDKLRNNKAIEHFTKKKMTQENKFQVVTEAIGRTMDMSGYIRLPQTEGIRTDRDGIVWEFSEWTEWVRERPFKTSSEAADFVRRKVRELEEELGGPGLMIRSHSDLDRDRVSGSVIEDPDADFRTSTVHEIRKLRENANQIVINIASEPGLELAYNCLGIEAFVFLYQDDPQLVSEWLELLCQRQIKRAHLLGHCEETRFIRTYDDIATTTSLLFSPSFLEKEFFPRLARIIAAWKEHGYRCSYHSDGNLNSVIPDIIECGAQGLHPIETNAGMDLAELKEKYGGRLVFIGGIDCSRILPYGTPQEVVNSVRRAIRDAGDGGGLILGSTSELHNGIPLENILAMFDAIEEYGTYPLNLSTV